MSGDDASILPDLVAGRLSTAVVSDILDDLGQSFDMRAQVGNVALDHLRQTIEHA